MLKILGLVICVMLSASAVGCADNNTAVEESSISQEEMQINKDVDEAYNYVVKKYDSNDNEDGILYEIEKAKDGVVIKAGLVSESTFKEAVTYSSVDYAIEQMEDVLKDFNELPGFIEVQARKEGINTENVNFYIEVYLFNNKNEFTDLIYSISSKDGVILNSIKHEVEYFKNNETSDSKSNKDTNKSQDNTSTNKKSSKSNNNTNSDDTRTSEEKHWDEHNSDSSKPPTTVVYHKCGQCGEDKLQNEMFKNSGQWYCNSCGLFYCSECGRRVYPKWLNAPSSKDYMHYQNDDNGAIVCGYCYIQN